MKKVLIAISLTLVLVIALAVPAFAGGKGAVSTDMVIHTDSSAYGQPGTVIGSAILNTTASGCLIVVVNLDDAEPIADYDLRIRVNDVICDVVDCLKVNAKGQGTANVKVDLLALDIADDATEIGVTIVVRQSFGPNTTPCYVNGPQWKTKIMVPLK